MKSSEVIQYIMIDKFGNPFGSVYFKDVDNVLKKTEFGIFIGEVEHIAKGYGQVVQLFVDFGLNTIGLKTINLKVIESNDRACHVYEKLGFKVISRQQ